MKGKPWSWLSACALVAGCAPQAGAPAVAPVPALLAAATAAPPAAEPTREEQLQRQDARHMARMGGWIALAMGSLAGLVTLETSVQMLHDKSVRDANCDASKACSTAGLNANTDIANLAGWNLGSWVVMAAGLGVGAFLVLTNPDEPESGTQVGVGPAGSGTGLLLRSAF